MRLSVISKTEYKPEGSMMSAPFTPFYSAMDIAKNAEECCLMIIRVHFNDEQMFNSTDGMNDTPKTSDHVPFYGEALTANDHLIIVFAKWMIFAVCDDPIHQIAAMFEDGEVIMQEEYESQRNQYIKSMDADEVTAMMKQAWQLMEQEREKQKPEYLKVKQIKNN